MIADPKLCVRVVGQCDATEAELRRHFLQRGAEGLNQLGGEYVLVIETAEECFLVSSAYGVCQYYYTLQDGKFCHAETVLAVMAEAGLSWQWNWRALADLALMEHTLEEETLHPAVKRVQGASIVHYRAGKVTVHTAPWEELHAPVESDAESCLAAFNEEVIRRMGDENVVSMTGGLDSRLILSSFLAHGVKPRLVTMGDEGNQDVVIARMIAGAYHLDIDVVMAAPEDYLSHGRAIAALTNGTKTSANWHTYIYPLKAGLAKSDVHFVGNNGEIARCYYLDKGVLALAADWIAPRRALREVWSRKTRPIFSAMELGGLHPQWREQYEGEHRLARLQRLSRLCDDRLLSGLDRFFLEQRVRLFHGNGFAMYGAHSRWCCPFLSPDWVRQVWWLGRGWKLGSNWHRYAFQRNQQTLMEFPVMGGESTVKRRAPMLYWEPLRRRIVARRKASCPACCASYPEWFRSGVLAEFVRDNASSLEEIVEPATVRKIVDDHRATGSRTRAMSLLLGQIFWRMAREEGPPSDAAAPHQVSGEVFSR